jgi:hypothetical protein
MQIKSVRPPDSADTTAVNRIKAYQSDFGGAKKMLNTQQMFAVSNEYYGGNKTLTQNPS